MTDLPEDIARAKLRASELISSGRISYEVQQSFAQLMEPIQIQSLTGETSGWFIGLAVDEFLIGFIILTPRFEFLRYSSFLECVGNLEKCPKLADWIDPQRILERAGEVAKPDDQLDIPFLSYDQSMDRIAWAVKVIDAKGSRATIFVAGTFAYLTSNLEDVTAGHWTAPIQVDNELRDNSGMSGSHDKDKAA